MKNLYESSFSIENMIIKNIENEELKDMIIPNKDKKIKSFIAISKTIKNIFH